MAARHPIPCVVGLFCPNFRKSAHTVLSRATPSALVLSPFGSNLGQNQNMLLYKSKISTVSNDTTLKMRSE